MSRRRTAVIGHGSEERASHERAVEEVAGSSWESGQAPLISVVVPTHNRGPFLVELAAALEAQRLPIDRFEVIVVDDDSSDGTWTALAELAARTPLRLFAMRARPNQGPAVARNLGAARARAPLVAFTDDDCLPTPSWLDTMVRAFEGRVAVVQGRTIPEPGAFGRSGPWDRTVWVTESSPLFETCNIAYRRNTFEELGGFVHNRPKAFRGTRHHFGEDVELGWRVVDRGGGVSFAPEALVHHRLLPGDYAGWLREQRRLMLFPGLVRRNPAMSQALWARVFLAPKTAAFDLAVVSAAAALAARAPWLLVGALPWVRARWAGARRRRGRHPIVRLAQLAVGDAVGLGSLLAGSVRNGRVVL